MPSSPAIDGLGQTYYRSVVGSGTEQDPYVSVVSTASTSNTGLIPKLVTDFSVSSLVNVVTIDVKNIYLVSLTFKNTGSNALTDFRISGSRGNSYTESALLAYTDADFTTLTGQVTANTHARVIESSQNPRLLPGNSSVSLAINTKDLYTLTIAVNSSGTTVNYEGLSVTC